MRVDFMRRVDHYIGVPVCFLLSIVASLERFFGLRRIKKGFKPRRILFIELSEMGSTILAYAAMKKAKGLFNAQIYFMIFKENEESIKLLDIVPRQNVLTIRSKSLLFFLLDIIKVIFKMRRAGIDTVIDLELFSRVTSVLSFLSGAKAIVGFYRYHMEGLYRGNFQTHRIEYNPHQHISQSFMSMVYSLKAPLNEVPMLKKEIKMDEIFTAKVASSAEEKKRVLDKLKEANPDVKERQIVLLNPNASQLLPIRKWPIERFRKLAEKLLKSGYFVVVTGTKSEREDARLICDYVNDKRCIDFTGKTSFKELIDLYNVSRVLVTNDSGPAHFASLTDINIVVIFGPETPKIYSPLSKNCVCVYSNFACSPCVSAYNHRKTPCTDSKCLDAIGVEEVFKVVVDKLK
jgi:ADP-heptose:LPS heptosyltransferase